MKVGSIDIMPVADGQMVFAEPRGFPPHDSVDFEPHRDYITPTGEFLNEIGGFLVATQGRLVLIDAGLGPAEASGEFKPTDEPNLVNEYLDTFRRRGLSEDRMNAVEHDLQRHRIRHGTLEASLHDLGVRPSQITDVVLTHLHPDHVGWVSRNGEPFFDRAKIWCHQADADHFLVPGASEETTFRILLGTAPTNERLAPVRDQLEIWTSDVQVAPGISLRHLPGHTPGNAIAVISSAGAQAYVLGDTFHCAYEIVNPRFRTPGDMDREQARMSKKTIRQEIENGKIAVASPHFPGMRFGRLFVVEGRRTWRWES
jgi:glyoxylase-like metal-dependent hydrolase (beta-lactamase superfamily II)